MFEEKIEENDKNIKDLKMIQKNRIYHLIIMMLIIQIKKIIIMISDKQKKN